MSRSNADFSVTECDILFCPNFGSLVKFCRYLQNSFFLSFKTSGFASFTFWKAFPHQYRFVSNAITNPSLQSEKILACCSEENILRSPNYASDQARFTMPDYLFILAQAFCLFYMIQVVGKLGQVILDLLQFSQQ